MICSNPLDGSVASRVPKIDAGLSGEVIDSCPSVAAAEVGVHRVPVPA
jgi:hypothetical protein